MQCINKLYLWHTVGPYFNEIKQSGCWWEIESHANILYNTENQDAVH